MQALRAYAGSHLIQTLAAAAVTNTTSRALWARPICLRVTGDSHPWVCSEHLTAGLRAQRTLIGHQENNSMAASPPIARPLPSQPGKSQSICRSAVPSAVEAAVPGSSGAASEQRRGRRRVMPRGARTGAVTQLPWTSARLATRTITHLIANGDSRGVFPVELFIKVKVLVVHDTYTDSYTSLQTIYI